MKTDYNGLMNILKGYNDSNLLNNVEVYVGEINGEYDALYSIEQKDVLDTIFSDGEINPASTSRDVTDANYVCVVRYKNSEDENKSELEKVFLFIEQESQKEFMFNMVQEDPFLYQKIFDQRNYKGNISKYKNDNSEGLKIVPSKELIELNKKNINKGSAR